MIALRCKQLNDENFTLPKGFTMAAIECSPDSGENIELEARPNNIVIRPGATFSLDFRGASRDQININATGAIGQIVWEES
ncbi:hypothetical protein BKI52_02635 [marine bacterium AO1-C]|nr:hypothetical protein BKI52_02635 [marine bacterium AO1-C]